LSPAKGLAGDPKGAADGLQAQEMLGAVPHALAGKNPGWGIEDDVARDACPRADRARKSPGS
jgi:hypothetical protein